MTGDKTFDDEESFPLSLYSKPIFGAKDPELCIAGSTIQNSIEESRYLDVSLVQNNPNSDSLILSQGFQ